MKLLKRGLLLAVLFSAILFSVQAYGETQKPNSVKVHFSVKDIPTITENEVVFELCDESGIVSFGEISHQLKREENEFEVEFPLPHYPIGTEFRLSIDDGVKGAYYNGNYGSEHLLATKAVLDENGVLKNVTEFNLELDCYWNKEAIIKIGGRDTFFNYIIKDDDVYVTKDCIEALGIRYEPCKNGEKPCFRLSTDEYHSATMYLNDIYAVFGNEPMNLSSAIFELDGTVYFPLSKVAVYFACNYTLASDSEYVREIALTPSVYSQKYKKESVINTKNISSKTNYMIWVSKKDFEVNIFTGNENNWTYEASYPCSIGAPSTPTIEGQFEYHQKQPRWMYDEYYCGPIMRFYRGYAFHSYLIRYNGKPYDSRLGKKISHGCIRMRPDDIGWMADNIPIYTKVYITP